MEEADKLRVENEKLAKEKKELQTALSKQEFDLKILHRQWKEVNDLVTVKERELEKLRLQFSRPGISVAGIIGLMLAAMLIGGLCTYFILPPGSRDEIPSGADSIPAVADTIPTAKDRKGDHGAEKLPAEQDRSKRGRKLVTDNPVQQPSNADRIRRKETELSTASSNTSPSPLPGSQTNLGEYKVRSKAYFHDQPDANTRRKAFIVHWNNAVLKPVAESGSFVYIAFTNHLGQTSEGWLNKNDLVKLE